MNDAAIRVGAVCVAFRPDMERLAAVLAATQPQVDDLFLIDNNDDAKIATRVEALAFGMTCCVYCGLEHNQGLANAFNQGIDAALRRGCTHVLLLDQDSIPGADMVRQLLQAHLHADRDVQVAATGPCYFDERLGPAHHVRFRSFPPEKLIAAEQAEVFSVDMLISSGSLIAAAALDVIGTMDARLFIDHVDTDWCLRARHLDFSLLAVRGATMTHRLGHRSTRLLGRTLPLHAPERLFYVFRNSLQLYRRQYAPWPWIASDIRRLAVVLGLHLLRGKAPWSTLVNATKGIAAGFQTLPAIAEGAAHEG